MASVTFDHVSRIYDGVAAVDDLSLEVADGEFLVLVGPSGCGKSTTLRMLAGLEEISAGHVFIGDTVVNDVPARNRDIAMVFQSYALYPHMSVFDNMAFSLSLRKVPRPEIDRRVREAAEVLGITELLTRKPRQLSGGQRQRVALGRAIVRQPAVFLLDEPLSNLDARLRVQTRAELSALHERLGTTFIYVTHDQVEAMTMATRIAVLDRGVLQQLGTPRELYDHPRNVFVAGFIGSPSMNFFEAELVGDGERVSVRAGDLHVPLTPGLWRLDGRQRVTVGIRPEHIHAGDYRPAGTDTIDVPGVADLAELMGNETLVHFHSGDVELLARIDPRADVRPGQSLTFALDYDRLHLFDPADGANLAASPGA